MCQGSTQELHNYFQGREVVFKYSLNQKNDHGINKIPSLKLTASLHLKMDGCNTIVSFWEGRFSGAMLVSGRLIILTNDGLCKWILRISSSPFDVTCAGDEEVGFYTLEV